MILLASVLFWLQVPTSPGSQIHPVPQAPFAKDIEAFKNRDSLSPPEKGQILFVGSSSFTNWTDVDKYFPKFKILNRGFGGSSIPDVIRYSVDIIFPYEPKQIVIYCGENDFAGDAALTPEKGAHRVETLVKFIRQYLPEVPIDYISMKPSPSRWSMRDKFIAANRLIADFCKLQHKIAFIDVWKAMLNDNGVPKPEIFRPDQLHMNAQGYKIWQGIIEPYLVR